MGEESKTFFQITGLVVGLGLLIVGIITTGSSEAFKCSAVLSLFLILLIIYIQTVVMKRIEQLEKKVKEKE